jgi:hypothetical protein
MKKMLFTAVFALIGFMASAQIMITADIDFSNDDFEVSEVTDFTTFGVGYSINENWTVGAMFMNETDHADHADHADHSEEDFRIFARYNWNESVYITANTSTEEISDNLRIGAGYSFAVYNSFYLEPNYTMDLQADDNDERNGRLNLGLSYRF